MKLYKYGYWILVGALTAIAALYVWFNGSDIDPSPQRRLIFVCLIGLILLLARGHCQLRGGLWHATHEIVARTDMSATGLRELMRPRPCAMNSR